MWVCMLRTLYKVDQDGAVNKKEENRMENYKCNDCSNKWETLPTWEKPTCKVCGEHLNVEEITDQK